MTRRQAKTECLKLHIEMRDKFLNQGHGKGSPYVQDAESTIQRTLQALGGLAGRW